MCAMRTEERPIGVGIVGLGRFGEFLLGAYKKMQEVRISAVCDANFQRAWSLAPEGAQAYEKFEHMLEDPAVELVVIATPPYLHASMAIQAARAGKHVLVEKPLATSLEEAEAVIKAARETRVCLTVNHVLRFHPLYQLVFRLIREGIFGELELFTLVNLATNEGIDPLHWFWDVTKSGGIHVEHGVHFFDLCNQLVGAVPTSVQGYAFVGAHGRVDRVAAVVGYGHKVFASFYHSFDRPRCVERTTLHLGLTRGEITVEGWIPVRFVAHGLVGSEDLETLRHRLELPLEVVGLQGSWVQIRVEIIRPDRQEDYKRAIQALMKDCARAILEKRAPSVTPEDALASVAVAIQAQQTALLLQG